MSNQNDEGVYKSIAGCLMAVILLPAWIAVASVWGGFVLVQLWQWFIVPTFELPVLQLWQAIGLDLIVSFMTHQYADFEEKKREPWEKLLILVARTLFNPLLYLLIGWLVLQFAGR